MDVNGTFRQVRHATTMSAIGGEWVAKPAAFYGSTGFEHLLSLWCSPPCRLTVLSADRPWQAYAGT
jgi:hypothetical protein